MRVPRLTAEHGISAPLGHYPATATATQTGTAVRPMWSRLYTRVPNQPTQCPPGTSPCRGFDDYSRQYACCAPGDCGMDFNDGRPYCHSEQIVGVATLRSGLANLGGERALADVIAGYIS